MGALGATGGSAGGLGSYGSFGSPNAATSTGWFNPGAVMDTGAAKVEGASVTFDDGGLRGGIGTLERHMDPPSAPRVDPMDSVAKVAATYAAYALPC